MRGSSEFLHKLGLHFTSFRSFLKELETRGVLRVETVLLGTLLLGAFLTSAGFFFGRTCSPWTLRILFSSVMVGLCIISVKAALKFIALSSVCLLFTAFTFSYFGHDAMAYHFPAQHLLSTGWNPVFDSTLEKLHLVVGNWGFWPYQTLFLQRFNALCGALVALAANLYIGDSFLNYVLLFALARCGYRFSRMIWQSGVPLAVLFGLLCALPTKVTSFLSGQVDYAVYASFALALLSGCMWWAKNRLEDLVLATISLIMCMSLKSTGMMNGCILIGVLGLACWQRKAFWIDLLPIAVTVLVIGASPLLTSWIQYGSPMYPISTFNPSVPTHDITADFLANADGNRMGYLMRMIYAWVSPSLAKWLGVIIYGSSGFNPEFYVNSGVAGLGTWFNILFCLGCVALLLARKNAVTILTILVFLLSNFAPLKFIGYSRYFPQIWLVPILALFNYIHLPACRGSKIIMGTQWGAIVVMVLLLGMSALRMLSYQGRAFAFESLRQKSIAQMKVCGCSWALPNVEKKWEYFVCRRMQNGGLAYSEEGRVPCCDKKHFIVSEKSIAYEISEFEKRFPVCNGPMSFLSFKWFDAYSLIPSPLWR